VGSAVSEWRVGQKVGVSWHGGHCFVCDSCRRGRFITCVLGLTAGISYDGGYADYMVAPAEAVVEIPEDVNAVEAAPMLCAGITVYNALRNSIARAGDTVAIHGLGGLGHLGVQFARKMGFHTIAVGRGTDKAGLAEKLGAHLYLDARDVDAAEVLRQHGGAMVILTTAPDAEAMSSMVNGLSAGGQLLVVAVPGAPLSVPATSLIGMQRSIAGWPSGTAIDCEDTLRFSMRNDVRAMVEEFPLERVAEAYQKMMDGKVRFRAVLKMG
jgi:D-arabinose 1-dehydrogenase-like Zn-dependent alcohol dehydrogenase